MGLYTTPETYSPEQLWQLLLGYDRSSALLAASISSQVHLLWRWLVSFYGFTHYGCLDCGYTYGAPTELYLPSAYRARAARPSARMG